MTKRYMRIDERTTNAHRLMVALDKLGIEYEWYGHDKHISVIEINVGNLAKTYNDAVNE
jgi:hypothetical protein